MNGLLSFLSQKNLEEFIHHVAHDLKEPTRGIVNFSSFLLEDYQEKLNAEGLHQLQTIIQLAQSLDKKIAALSQISLIACRELLIQEIDLSLIVHNTLRILQQEKTEPSIILQMDDELPTIFADPILVRELFIQLMSNTILFCDKESIQLTVGYISFTPQKMDDAKSVPPHIREHLIKNEIEQAPIFFIKDNGPGIESYIIDRVFKIFVKASKSGANSGMGAGLTICKEIVLRHGGNIWVESVKGEGTTVYFYFGPR